MPAHLAALDLVYADVVRDVRAAIESAGKVDPITEDLLIGQAAGLEQFHWFIRAHLENAGGTLVTDGAGSESGAADMARNA